MRLKYDEKYKSTSIFDFARLSLKKGEVARILMIEPESSVEFVHYVDLGSESELNGYYICLGDFEFMCKNGSQDDKCGWCKKAKTGSAIVKGARRRFVTHIIRYRTDAKGNVIIPVSIELNLWVYGDDKYNSLTSKAVEWGDLRKHDLKLTCTRQQYQSYEIEVAADALWMKDENLKKAVVKAYQENKRNEDDLNLLLGRKMDASEVAKIIYLIETGSEAPSDRVAAPGIGSALPTDLLDMELPLDNTRVKGAQAEAVDLFDLTGSAGVGAKNTTSAGKPDSLDFDELLKTK